MAIINFERTSFHVDAPGMFTTVQDSGRVGYQQFGMPVAGPMDGESYALGQALVGNFEPKGSLECTVLAPTLTLRGNCIVAFTGADMQPTINHVKIPRYIPFLCHAGDVISGGFAQCGMRMYISFSGGIDVPLVNGSVATHTKSKIGGFYGRPLQVGDTVYLHRVSVTDVTICRFDDTLHRLFNVALYNRGGRYCHEPFRVVLGAQSEAFTRDGIEAFGSGLYTLTERCDRMGFRLKGPTITHKIGADIISDGAVFGSIQVPADGQPIVLMADRQTTGGYTKIGTVITPDLPRLSQLPVGDDIRFYLISIEEGQYLYKEYMSIWQQRMDLARLQHRYIFDTDC